MALPTLTLSDSSREKLRALFVPACHVLFWARWAFRLLFIGPAVCSCLALALSSQFSVENFANDMLRTIAEMQHSSAPPDNGFIMLETCTDPDQHPGQVQKQSFVCKTHRWEQVPIKKASAAVSKALWEFYAVGVLLTFGMYFTMGSFGRSRKTFLGKLKNSQPDFQVVSSETGASNEAGI
jgi:hypothetical protein